MSKRFLVLAIAWGLGLGAAASFAEEPAPTPGQAQVLDMIIASIDGEPITLSDLERQLKVSGAGEMAKLVENREELNRRLRELVVAKLLEREADQMGVVVADEQINAYVEEIKRQNGVDDEEFEKLLKEKGLSLEDYRKQVKEDITRTRIVSMEVRSKVGVSDEDVMRYIEEHPDSLPARGQIRVKQILYKFEGVDSKEAFDALKAQAQSALERVKSGEDWGAVGADRYVDLGYIDIDELRPELGEALKNLKEGEVAELVQSSIGFHVLQLVSKKSDESVIDDELKSEIRDKLFRERFEEKLERFFTEELFKKYRVEIKM